MKNLTAADLGILLKGAFPPFPGDRALSILVDIPRHPEKDTAEWKKRRSLAGSWHRALRKDPSALGLQEINLIAYPDVGSNNADLPDTAFRLRRGTPARSEDLIRSGDPIPFQRVFEDNQIFLALTEYSTTAPLKNAAKRFGFRAATMPGFSIRMIPALKIDYEQVNIRVSLLKEKLDRAQAADIEFLVDGKRGFSITFDLRFRQAHSSGGRFPEKGTAGNLPSGEAYIVPYEGERGEKSRTDGILPVQIGEEIVLFTVRENRAVAVEGSGRAAATEREHLEKEPAYGNMAELGFGVLAAFGIQPVGEILLDEKLGFHVAFGRSDHFGGTVGPGQFSAPQEVIHLDRIYIPSAQPKIRVESVVFRDETGSPETIIEGDRYVIFS